MHNLHNPYALPSPGGMKAQDQPCQRKAQALADGSTMTDMLSQSGAATAAYNPFDRLALVNSRYGTPSDEEGDEDSWEDALESQRTLNKEEPKHVFGSTDLARQHDPELCEEGGDNWLGDMQEAVPQDVSAQHRSHSSVALDSLDIEGLIASYNPVIHPSVRRNILRRQDSLLSMQEEASAQTRPSSSRAPSLYSSQDHAASATSLHTLPAATSNPLRQAKLTRKSSTSSFTGIFRKKASYVQPLPADGRRWLSGALETGTADVLLPAYAQSFSLARSRSQSSDLIQPVHQSNATRERFEGVASAVRLPLGDAISSSLSPVSMNGFHDTRPRQIPRKAVPSRFTLPTSQSQAAPTPVWAEAYSPRSSTSSHSQTSFRWSSSSRSTASSAETGRTSLHRNHSQSIKRSSSGRQIGDIDEDDPSIAVGIVTSEEDEAVFKPGHSRCKESIDSMDSFTMDNVSIAEDFPAPPPLSRQNSSASAASSRCPTILSIDSSRTQQLSSTGLSLPKTTSSLLAAREKDDNVSLRSASSCASLVLPVHRTAPLRQMAKEVRSASTGVTHRALLSARPMGRSRSAQAAQ